MLTTGVPVSRMRKSALSDMTERAARVLRLRMSVASARPSSAERTLGLVEDDAVPLVADERAVVVLGLPLPLRASEPIAT